MKKFIMTLLMMFLLASCSSPLPSIRRGILGNSFYVSVNGNDTNNGSLSSPFKTIKKAITIAQNGDAVIVSSGTYREYVNVNKSITLIGNDAIIDGINATGSVTDGLVSVVASNVEVSGFTISNAKNYGLSNFGNNSQFLNNIIHHTQGAGIWMRNGINNIFDGNELYFTVLQNSTSFNGSYYICNANNNTGWPSAINSWGSAQNNTWKNNFVHDNCGEGIVSILNDTIDNNTFKDNWSVEIYIAHNGAKVTNNIIIDTKPYIIRGTNQAWRSVPSGITIGDESTCLSDNSTITGNTITGSRYGISFYAYISCSGIKNTLIDNNTIIDSWEYGLRFLSGSHINSIVSNNKIQLTHGRLLTVQSAGISFTGNTFYSNSNIFEWMGKSYNFVNWSAIVPGNYWGSSPIPLTPTLPPTLTNTPIIVSSNTPTKTSTPTPTMTSTSTSISVVTSTSTPTVTATKTNTVAPTNTPTSTFIPTPTAVCVQALNVWVCDKKP